LRVVQSFLLRMRLPCVSFPHLAILLCTTLISGVTSTAVPCDGSLIKGATTQQIDYTNNELKCKGSNVIKIGGTQYDSLTCDATHGWKAGTTPLSPAIDATSKITIQCVTKHPCIDFKINGAPAVSPPPEFSYANKELTCMEGRDVVFNGKRYEKLICDPTGWKKADGSFVTTGVPDFTVSCAAKNCDNSFIKNFATLSNDIEYNNNVLTCKNGRLVQHKNELYDNLSCDKTNNKWNDASNEVHKGEIEVSCVEICTTDQPAAVIERTSSAGNYEIKCKDQLKMIVTGTKEYLSLKCDKDGWKDENDVSVVSDVKTQLPVTCNDYCSVSGSPSPPFDSSTSRDSVTATCTDPTFALHQGTTPLDGNLKCSFKEGWKAGTTALTNKKDTPLTVSCEKVCTHSVDSNLDILTVNKLKCTDADKRLFVNNKKRVEITCDAYSGWKDSVDASFNPKSTVELEVSCVPQANECTNFASQTNSNVEFDMKPGGTEATIQCSETRVGENKNALIRNSEFLHSNLK
ncbi:hypothetical protein PFISCL1PPCAC_28456, partial [Pristionchus fissidentatus]